MVKAIERETYQIPIPDEPIPTLTGSIFVQTCAIPVIRTELRIGPLTLQYLRFSIIPGEHSLLDILAGGENLEIAGTRIRAQMIHRLKIGLATTQESNPPPKVGLEVETLSKYFQLIQSPAE